MPPFPFRRPASVPFALLIAIGLSGSLVACHKKEAPKVEAVTEKVPPVATKFVKPAVKMLPETLELSGPLDADQTSEVATAVAGAVKEVKVDVGDRVKKGDPLVLLDVRDAAMRAAQANAAVAQAQARLGNQKGAFDPNAVPDVVSAKEAMDLAVSDANRQKALFDSGSSSDAAWDAARIRAEQAKAQYDLALAMAKQSNATVASAAASAGLASKAVADSTIRAPFDGAVAEKRVNEGEYATVGKVVAVVVADNPLRLRLDVAEADVSKVQAGKPVEVLVAAYPDKVFRGVVKRIGASIKATSRTLPIEAEIENKEGTLRAGMFARARVYQPGQTTKAILVPESAVGTTGNANRVFVKNGTHVTEKLVRLGRHDGDLVEVIGAGETDDIATTNVDKLVDGGEVTGG